MAKKIPDSTKQAKEKQSLNQEPDYPQGTKKPKMTMK